MRVGHPEQHDRQLREGAGDDRDLLLRDRIENLSHPEAHLHVEQPAAERIGREGDVDAGGKQGAERDFAGAGRDQCTDAMIPGDVTRSQGQREHQGQRKPKQDADCGRNRGRREWHREQQQARDAKRKQQCGDAPGVDRREQIEPGHVRFRTWLECRTTGVSRRTRAFSESKDRTPLG